MKRLVVVGAGLAGHRAARAARRHGFEGELLLVGDELHRPYDRPPLSKQVLAGKMDYEAAFYDCDGLEAEFVLGSPASGLDLGRQLLTLADDRELGYDELLLATGRRAREWPELPEMAGFFRLRGLDDARALREAAQPGVKAVIVGAGFIGCEVAATLRGLGIADVALIDVAPYPMPALGPEVGARAIKLHEAHGVTLRLSSGVEAFEGDDRVRAVVLNDGERIDADLVLLALGSVPNTEWLEGSGLELKDGAVAVDDRCIAVGTDNVAAAGDIALYPHPACPGEPICIEHWTNAREMGEIAARNLLVEAGSREPYVAVPTFWSDQYDVKIKSAGLLKLAEQWKVIEEEDNDKPRLIVEGYRQKELVGAVVFNKNRSIIDYQRNLQSALAV